MLATTNPPPLPLPNTGQTGDPGSAFDESAWRSPGATVYCVEATVFAILGLAWQFARQGMSEHAVLDAVVLNMLFTVSLLALILTTFLDAPSIREMHFQVCFTLFLFYLYALFDEPASGSSRFACALFGKMAIYQAAGGVTLAILTILTLCSAAAAHDRLWRSAAWAEGLLVLLPGLHASLKQRYDASPALMALIYSLLALFMLASLLRAVLQPRLMLFLPDVFQKTGMFGQVPWILSIVCTSLGGILVGTFPIAASATITWVQLLVLLCAELFLVAHAFLSPEQTTPKRPQKSDKENQKSEQDTQPNPTMIARPPFIPATATATPTGTRMMMMQPLPQRGGAGGFTHFMPTHDDALFSRLAVRPPRIVGQGKKSA